MANLKTVGADHPDDVLAAIEEDGGVIVTDYLDADLTRRLRSCFETAIAPLPWCNTGKASAGYGDVFFGQKTKRLHGLLQYGPDVEAVLMRPVALDLGRRLLDCERLLMSTGELMAIGPGEVRQALHRDGDSWRSGRFEREILFSVNVALTDFTAANGATVVVPGSHRWPADRRPKEHEIAYAEMAAGSALVYRGGVVHSGGANDTDQTRIGLYLGYIPSWLRPLESPAVTLPDGFMAGLKPEVQEMLGYSPDGFVALL